MYVFYLDKPAEVNHETGDEGGALVRDYVFRDSDSTAEQKLFPSDGLRGGFLQRNCLWVTGGIVD